MRSVPITFTLLAALTAGCSQVVSTEVHTRAIDAQFTITPLNDGTSTINGVLRVGFNSVTLGEGDTIVAATDSDTAVMAEQHDYWGTTSFSATLPTDAPGSPVTIVFARGSGEASANSSVVLPSRFNLAPIVAPNASRSSAIRLAWDSVARSNEVMHWSASGNCIVGASGDIAAGATTLTIPAGTLASTDESAKETCSVTIDVSRSTSGTVDATFASGSAITAVRILSNSLTLQP